LDPGKVTAIQTIPPPTNLTELRRFLGMTNHLSKFIPNLAVSTDALSYGLGAILLLLKPVAYIFPSMTTAEQR